MSVKQVEKIATDVLREWGFELVALGPYESVVGAAHLETLPNQVPVFFVDPSDREKTHEIVIERPNDNPDDVKGELEKKLTEKFGDRATGE